MMIIETFPTEGCRECGKCILDVQHIEMDAQAITAVSCRNTECQLNNRISEEQYGS